MENRQREMFEVFGGNLTYWLLPLVNTNSESAMVQQNQRKNYLAVGQSPENRAERQKVLKNVDREELGSDVLSQFVLCKGYEATWVWRSSVYCGQHVLTRLHLNLLKKRIKF